MLILYHIRTVCAMMKTRLKNIKPLSADHKFKKTGVQKAKRFFCINHKSVRSEYKKTDQNDLTI